MSVVTWVSPAGDDHQTGTSSDPVASLSRAVELSRAADPAPDAGRRIVLRGGDYFDTYVELDSRDSGLTIEAAPEETPVLYGGCPVTGWQQDGPLWVADVPGVKDRTRDFRSLLVNGRYAPRARFPETGAIRHDSEFPVRWMSTTKGGWERKPTTEELTTLKFPPDALLATLDPDNAELTLYHSWDESLVGVAALDRAAGVMRFSTPAGHPPGAFGAWKEQARTFVVWNTREGLTQPGQWYLDRTGGRLVYWPLPGEAVATARIIAPTQTVILRLSGAPETPLRDVALRGLTFAVTTTPMKAGGFGANAFEGAIEGESLVDCTLDHVELFGTGGWGARLLKTTGLQVRRCTVRHTGAGGLAVRGERGELTDNLLHDVGLTYPSAMALNCHGADWLVAHNEIHHTPYSAITGGGENQRYEHNLFHHVIQELVDGAAIYLFAAKGSAIRGNYTHSVRDEQVHAYYLDEQSVESVVEGNLAVGVPWPLHNHMATRCIIRDNVCVHTGNLAVTLANCDGFIMERNVLAAGGQLRAGVSYTGLAALRQNVFWSATGDVRWELHDRLPSLERNAGPVPLLPLHEQTVIADPKVTCSPDGLVNFAPDSPATALGLKPLDVRHAGRRPVRNAQEKP